MKRALRRTSRRGADIWGEYVDGPSDDVWGDFSEVRGDLSEVRGDLSEVRGYLFGVEGNLDDCEINRCGPLVDIEKFIDKLTGE